MICALCIARPVLTFLVIWMSNVVGLKIGIFWMQDLLGTRFEAIEIVCAQVFEGVLNFFVVDCLDAARALQAATSQRIM